MNIIEREELKAYVGRLVETGRMGKGCAQKFLACVAKDFPPMSQAEILAYAKRLMQPDPMLQGLVFTPLKPGTDYKYSTQWRCKRS